MTSGTQIAYLAAFDWEPWAAGLVGVFVLVPVLILAHRIAFRKRQRLFASRAPISEDDWFKCYYPLAVEERPIVVPALQELARLLDIHWTQLRVEDRFSGNLHLKWRFFNTDQDELDDFFEWVISRAKRNGISLKSLPPGENELGRFLDQLREAYQERSVTASGDARPETADRQ